MRQDFITCSAVYSFAPHSQVAVEAIPHSCVSDRNRPTPVRRRLNLTHAGLGKLISGGVGLTSFINVWSPKVFSRHSMLYIYILPMVPYRCLTGRGRSAFPVQLAQMGILIYVAATVHEMVTGAFYVGGFLAPEHGKVEAVRLFGGEGQLIGCLLR